MGAFSFWRTGMKSELELLAERCLAEAIRIDTMTISKFPTAEILREAGRAVLLLDSMQKEKKNAPTSST